MQMPRAPLCAALLAALLLSCASPASSARQLSSLEAPGRDLLQADPTVPPSPYADPKVCLTNGISVDVNGFPSSPFRPKVFNVPFQNVPKLKPSIYKQCDTYNNCFDAYEIDTFQFAADLATGVGCPAGTKTQLVGYGGQVPGPTLEAPVGRQVMVRFKNSIDPKSKQFPPHEPCTNGRQGRPMSIHKHGSPALAPWDGYAENEICYGESKDYVYPCQRAGTLWYHDHALDITSDNAYYGQAGYFYVREGVFTYPNGTKKLDVNGQEIPSDTRWGLQGMTEWQLVLQDKVFTSDCQWLYDHAGAHQNNLYGDVNYVSGLPFPVISAHNEWNRFRILNGATSRPYLLSIRDFNGKPISQDICWMLGSEGGFRRQPVTFPKDGGLFVGVAERYDFACDFSKLTPGSTYYLWNHYDDLRMKDVPFFCYSHLVAKITIDGACSPGAASRPESCGSVFQFPTNSTPTFLDRVVTPKEFSDALAMAQAQKCTRTFDFGRSGGQWTINGQTWASQKIAASDVGANTWEVWCFNGHGGWFHPIHVHLVDFYVLLRYQAGDFQTLESYETDVSKDVVQLHPGAQVAVLVRWGPHRGEYMFHCHNLVHEDNAMMRSATGNSRGAAARRPIDPELASLVQLEFDNTTSTGTLYDSYQNPLDKNETAVPWAQVTPLADKLNYYIGLEPYRIFYPGTNDRALLCDKNINKWLVKPCPDFP